DHAPWGSGARKWRTRSAPHVRPSTGAAAAVAAAHRALLNMLDYLRSERSLDFVCGALYTYFAFFTLFWIFPYAALTVRARAWLTRWPRCRTPPRMTVQDAPSRSPMMAWATTDAQC